MATKIPTGNRFLVVPQITKEDARKQAEKAKRAAEKRAPIVEEEIRQRRNRWNDAAQRAQRAYNQRPLSSDPNIVTTWLNTINSPSQEPSGTLKKPSAPSRGVFSFKGQYGGAGTQARESLQSILPTPGNFAEYAQFAAKRDTTSDPTEMKFYEKYALPQESHHSYIEQGNLWMTDSEALTNWILGDAAVNGYFSSDAEYDAACARQKQYEDYMDRYLRGVTTFDPETGRARIEQQFTADAPLPPWIPPTGMNNRKWQYYVTYSHDVVQSAADTYNVVTQAQKDFKTTPYKSAFSTNRTEQDIDSFLDILVSSRSMDEFKQNTADYFKYYVINPIKSGHVLTAGANALWNMMDTMDIAGRGVRAFVAGDTVLGGLGETDTRMITKGYSDSKGEGINLKKSKLKTTETKDSTFKGQNVYWANIEGHSQEEIERAQRLFMQNGGYELLLKKHPGEASKAVLGSEKMSMSEEELTKKLNEAFAKEGIRWQDIYTDLDENFFTKDRTIKDVKQGIENVKLAYSQPESAFNADTGSIGADIIIESVLDPGLLLGGISKNISKNSLESAAEVAFRDGFTRVLENSDDAVEILKDKRVRAAINEFIHSNEGKNIIFKDVKRFDNDLGVLVNRLDNEIPHLFGNKTTKESLEAYKKTKGEFGNIIKSHLVSKNQSVNTKIIESTGWAREFLDTKTYRAAYMIDKTIDHIDSAIIKASFAAPWGLVKGLKGGKVLALSKTAVGRFYYGKKMRQAAAAALVRDEATKAVDVTSLPRLVGKFQGGQLAEDEVRIGLRDIAKAYDDASKGLPKVMKDFADGKLSSEDVMRYMADQIRAISAGKYSDVADLKAVVNNIEVRYAGDVCAAYDRLVRNFDMLTDMVYKRSDAAVADFLTEVSHVDNLDDLKRLFRDNMDNSIIMGLREEVTNKAAFDVSVEQIDNIIKDLQAGNIPLGEADLKWAVGSVKDNAEKTVERVLRKRDLKNLLERNYSYLLDPNNTDSYIRKLRPLFELTHGGKNEITLDEAIKCIESAKRSLLTSEHIKADTITKGTAGLAHRDPRMADLRRLKDTIRGLDIVSLKDNEVITIMHVDRMAMMQKYMEAPAIAKTLGADYDNIIAPAVNMLKNKELDNIDLASDTLVKDIMRLEELKYGRDRTDMLMKQFQSIHTLSDNKLHTLMNGLGNNFGRAHGTLTDTISTPGLLRRNLETTAKTQGGTQKIGINGLTDILRSVDSVPSPYIKVDTSIFDDVEKGAAYKAKYDKIANASALDPTSYVKKQMLASLMMDPDMALEYNARYAAGNTPIFYHVNTTGLNSEINEIASISCIKWTPLDVSDADPLTIEKILDAIPDEPILFKRGMTDAQIDGVSENVLRRMDMKGLSNNQLKGVMRDVYRATDRASMKSEADIIEDFCKFLQDETVIEKAGKGFRRSTEVNVPSLIVHDLDGFNIPYFNKRAVSAMDNLPENSSTRGYVENFSKRIQSASDNTYSRLASVVGDESFTQEELDQIEKLLNDYIKDINDFAGDNFDPFDFEEYGRTFERVMYESTSPVTDELSSVRSAIVNASTGSAVDIEAYKHAMQDIADFAKYPKRFAFMSSGSKDNEVAVALRALGKDSVNVESRIYVKDVMSFFDIADAETGQLRSNIGAMQKMHNLSQYVIRNRDRAIVGTAEEFLLSQKTQFDEFIEAVRNIGRHYSSGSEYSFLADIKTPNTAVESYLLSQKLYDDYVKYWCFSDLSDNMSDRIDVLNSFKERLNALYKDTYDKSGELFDETRELSKERWDKFRADKVLQREAYNDLNTEIWNSYISQRELAEDLYLKAKKTTEPMWEEYRMDKEYRKFLYDEAKAESDKLWKPYREYKKTLDQEYKRLKAQSNDISKRYRFWKNKATSSDVAQQLYRDFKEEYSQIDWKSYKEAKAKLNELLEDTQRRSEQVWDAFRAFSIEMSEKYDLNTMLSESSELWDAFKEASDLKALKKVEATQRTAMARDMFDASVDNLYRETMSDTDYLWSMFDVDKKALWEEYKKNPEKSVIVDEFFDELMKYFNDYRPRIFDEFTTKAGGLGFDRFRSGQFDEIFKLLDGEKHPEIFKSAAKSDYVKTVYSYRDGVMKQGIDMATKLSEANSSVAANIRQLDWIDRYYINAGISSRTDRMTGMLHMKAKTLFDMLDSTDLSRRESFQTFIREASEAHHLRVRQQALDSLRVDGKFSKDALVSELVYNNFNHVTFNSHAYSVAEMKELRDAVKQFQKEGADYLSYYEDRATGNIFIYLNYNAQITTDGTKRFLNNVQEIERPVRNAVPFTEFDELKSVLHLEDIEDFRDIYEQLKICWDDTRVLSEGKINGTSGKTVSRRQAEEYLETLTSELKDMLSPKDMLLSETARDIVYDPGFVRNEDSDILLDFLDTLNRQADVAKEDAVLINEVFASDSSLNFNELSKYFTDEELIAHFGNNPDYVVVTLTTNPNTRTGLQVRQLKVDNMASLKVAKEAPNTTILPYDMFYEVADIMNRTPQEGYYRKLLSKYLLVYKAFAMVKPGTWLRNYVDATTKTAMDDGRDLTNIASILPYQSKAMRDMNTYSQILKADPALLTKSNWEMIQRTFKTDMTFDDFELLRGVLDSDRFKSADRYFLNKDAVNRGGRQVIAGENAGLRGLPEADIKTAFKKYLASESDLPLSQNEFLDIYLGRVKAADDVMEQFDDMMRRLSSNMHNAEAPTIFDKTINNMFKPFGAVENLVRYSQTMYLMDQGLSQNQILKHIHATQFYTAPSWGAFNKLETIMPFITFRYNNFMYWMRMMDENPRFFRYFEDVYGTIAEDTIENMIDEGQEMDYESDSFFQGGSIPLGDDGIYLKLGNSFLSSINDFYGGPELLFGQYGALNPLLRETLRFSAYGLGLNSKEFFSGVDLDVSKDISVQNLIGLLPGGNLVTQVYKDLNKMPGTFDDNGPTVNTLWQVLSSLGVLGIRKNYSSGGKLDFDSWQEELAAQGKWYDANLGKIVPLSEKNEYGANDPNNSWDDVQAYMLVHKGKLWDANQHKFVTPDELSINLDPRTADVNFDFENDPEAWDKLQAWMKLKGKVYDYNQRKFVTPEQYISGGLNDPNITFKEKNQLMYEKFGLLWDANQNTYVTPDKYMRGGLNDFSQLEGKAFLQHWNEVKSLRRALYGEEYMYDPEKGKKAFVKVYEPSVVTVGDFFKNEEYDDYFSRLGIPRLQNEDVKFHVSRDGFLVTDDGRYILTRNNEYNARVFDNFKYSSGGYNRSPRGYSKFKKQVYQAFRANKNSYKGRTLPSHYYTGYGWNNAEGYYRFNFQYNYQYHNPQPAAKLNRLLSPRINYPYGGGYNKYSFYTR